MYVELPKDTESRPEVFSSEHSCYMSDTFRERIKEMPAERDASVLGPNTLRPTLSQI